MRTSYVRGLSISPTIVTNPVVNTTAGLYEFRKAQTGDPDHKTECSPVYVANRDSDTEIYVKINGTTAAPASATNYDVVIEAESLLELTREQIAIQTLSIWFPTGGSVTWGSGYIIKGWSISSH